MNQAHNSYIRGMYRVHTWYQSVIWRTKVRGLSHPAFNIKIQVLHYIALTCSCSALKLKLLGFLYLRSRYIAVANVPYRVLTHSHSATGLYNSANLSQSAISLHQLFTSCPHLTCKRAAFGLVLFFAIFTFWIFGFENILILSCFYVPFYLHYYSEIIYDMDTYPHLVSGQIPHIYYVFIQ